MRGVGKCQRVNCWEKCRVSSGKLDAHHERVWQPHIQLISCRQSVARAYSEQRQLTAKHVHCNRFSNVPCVVVHVAWHFSPSIWIWQMKLGHKFKVVCEHASEARLMPTSCYLCIAWAFEVWVLRPRPKLRKLGFEMPQDQESWSWESRWNSRVQGLYCLMATWDCTLHCHSYK